MAKRASKKIEEKPDKKSAVGKGPAGFDEYYSQAWGVRWPALKQALLADSSKVCLPNPFVDAESSLSPHYELDEASIWAAQALQVEAGQSVLDMCAAPGGKSLVNLFGLYGNLPGTGHWTLNDLSKGRLSRLRRVIREHIPTELQQNIKTTNFDASRWGLYQSGAFDRVMLDAPCSGEQHLLQTAVELEKWSLSRSKRLAQRQYALLCAGLQALKVGGEMVYATCTVSPLENDAVIAKLLKKKADQVKVLSSTAACGEATEYGWQVLPDSCAGRGPMYFCRLRKV